MYSNSRRWSVGMVDEPAGVSRLMFPHKSCGGKRDEGTRNEERGTRHEARGTRHEMASK